VFDSLKPDPSNIPIQLADNHSCKVEGFGNVSIPNGKLHDVLYVPELKYNLLSVVKLCQDYKIEFYKDMCYVIDPNTKEVVANAKLGHDNLFQFSGFTSSRNSMHKDIVEHEKLAHLNTNHISSNMVEILPPIAPSKINHVTNKVQIARNICIVENNPHDSSNAQDVQFSERKIVSVEDQPPSLNPTPHISTFIPPIFSYNGNDTFLDHDNNANVDNGNQANVETNGTFIHHDSSSSDKSVKRKTKWFQKLLSKRDQFLEWVDFNLGGLITANTI
jgi:hypothetical protein